MIPINDSPCANERPRSTRWGRCTLTPPDSQLKGAWFQPLNLLVNNRFQNVPFKCNLRRYNVEEKSAPGDEDVLSFLEVEP
jgi:hypothetical protein